MDNIFSEFTLSNILFNLVFAIVGIILGNVFTPKDDNSHRHNGTSVQQVQIIFTRIIHEQNIYEENRREKSPTSTSSDDSKLKIAMLIAAGIIGASLYAKYHQNIISVFSWFTIGAFASVITVALKLRKNNNYDKLNQIWTVMMLLIIFVNFIIIYFMTKQEVIINGDFESVGRIVYYLLGLIIAIVLNIILLLLIIHLFSLNSFIVRKGRISGYILSKTILFLNSPKIMLILVVVLCVMAILCSSGVAYEFITKLNQRNLEDMQQLLENNY